MPKGCGPCNLCCKLLAVPDIKKPARMLCWWTGVHGGCQRHAEKKTDPNLAACDLFECVWLASQKSEGALPGYLRPDMCHVVLGPTDRNTDRLLYVQVDPEHSDSWKKPEVQEYLMGCLVRGWSVEVIIDEMRFSMNEHGGLDQIPEAA